MIYKPFDIVVVPFPFTDSDEVKRRPALVISSHNSFNEKINHSVLLMITSARNKPWPLDSNIKDFESVGLSNPSIIRMKMFTLDHRLIIKKVGSLGPEDQNTLKKNMRSLLGELL